MKRLYLVRNGRTEEGAGFDANPRLDDVGREQAEAVAKQLGPLPRMPILSSPQRRALETAEPLARRWQTSPVVDEAVSLMPLPSPETCDRKAWLMAFMKNRWRDAPDEQAGWREECLARIASLQYDTAIFSHYLVINMIVGAALRDDRATVFQPDNGAITILEVADGNLSLIERGRQAATWLL